MKTLFCLFGNLRAGEWPYRTFVKQFGEDAHVALAVGDNYPNSPWRKHAKYKTEFDENTKWWEKPYDIFLPGWRKLPPVDILWGPSNGKSSGMIVFSARYYLKKLIESIETKYDRYVLTRSDQVYVDNKLPQNIEPKTLYAPYGQEWGGVPDRFLVADHDTFVNILDVFPTFQRHSGWNPNPANPETLLKLHCKDEGIKIKQFPRWVFLAGREGEQSRWSKPTTKIHGNSTYFAKYNDEYSAAVAYLKERNMSLDVLKD